MNTINFNQAGGFPLSTNILDTMQSAYTLLNSFSDAIGDNCIISGCDKVGQQITDGIVILNGELLPFKGSLFVPNSNLAIREDIEDLIFENSSSKNAIFKRYAIITTDAGVPYESMKRIRPLSSIMPVGMITMWSGSTLFVPHGWALCDGSNDTPDLRGRFIVGAGIGKYNVGDKGGLDTVRLTIDEMPSHTHTSTLTNSGSHSHNYEDSYLLEAPGYPTLGGKTTVNRVNGTASTGQRDTLYFRNHNTKSSGSHTHDLKINNTGSGLEHENRPPYYALAFIMYKG